MNVFLFEAGDVGPRIAELSIINADSWWGFFSAENYDLFIWSLLDCYFHYVELK